MHIFNITKHQYYKFLINSLAVSENMFTFAPAKMVDHPQRRVCDDWYIVNEYLFWGPSPPYKWPAKKEIVKSDITTMPTTESEENKYFKL